MVKFKNFSKDFQDTLDISGLWKQRKICTTPSVKTNVNHQNFYWVILKENSCSGRYFVILRQDYISDSISDMIHLWCLKMILDNEVTQDHDVQANKFTHLILFLSPSTRTMDEQEPSLYAGYGLFVLLCLQIFDWNLNTPWPGYNIPLSNI